MKKEDYRKFASEVMIDATKTLITLASGFFVLSTTLVNLLSDGVNDPIKGFWLLITTWMLLIISIGSGILALGSIATSAHDDQKFDLDSPWTAWTLRGQQVTFLLAFIAVSRFTFVNH